jgi:hypothetical protein
LKVGVRGYLDTEAVVVDSSEEEDMGDEDEGTLTKTRTIYLTHGTNTVRDFVDKGYEVSNRGGHNDNQSTLHSRTFVLPKPMIVRVAFISLCFHSMSLTQVT